MNRFTPDPPESTNDEQQLIAFHLGEACEEKAIRLRLEHDTAFAALSEEIAHTLRVFSADPIAPPDTEAAWQRLRSTLPPLETPVRKSRLRWLWATPVAALVLLLAIGLHVRHRRATSGLDNAAIVHLRPPAEIISRSGEADHLDRAERWLTAVNHTSDLLDPATRAEGQELLTQNALYLRDARARGDLPDAAVLDQLDRVLTTSNHPSEAGLQLRLDMNTDGLLFQIRILRQNQTAPNGDLQ